MEDRPLAVRQRAKALAQQLALLDELVALVQLPERLERIAALLVGVLGAL